MRGKNAIWTVLVIVLIIAGVFIAINLLGNNNTVEEATRETTDAVQDTRDAIDNDLLSKIVRNPEQYYDQDVTVAGEIQDVANRRAFKISDQTAGDELLVVIKQPLTQSQVNEAEEFFEDNADVKAKGTVRKLTIAEIERDFNIDLSPELEVSFRDKPVLIANSFSFGDNKPVLDFNQGP